MDGFVFTADVPEKDAIYHGWAVYNDPGYWGGEQARFRRRQILANNQVVFTQDRGDAGPTEYLYKFEHVEPRPGGDLWDLYMKDLFAPRRFTCRAEGGKVRLKFTADAGISCKVAAIVLYPDAIKAEGEKWVAQVEARNRAEFESRATYLGTTRPPREPPAAAAAAGYWLGFPGLEDDVLLTDAPGPASVTAMPRRVAARGQRVSFTFAVRPLKDFPGPVQLAAADLKRDGGGGTIPAAEVDLRYAHHGTHRTYNDLAYTIGPDTLRPLAGSGLTLATDLTHQFWVTVHVPADTAPGAYTSAVTLTAGDLKVTAPLVVDVLPFALDEPDFSMGFFGADVPACVREARGDDAWRDLFRAMREGGMNSFSGGPNVRFDGLDAAGKPALDFAAVDRFMRLAREAGFTKELSGYGGPGMVVGLHDGHAVGPTGEAWAKKTGRPFGELLAIVWAAVRDHAKDNDWLPVTVSVIDEPRVLDQAGPNAELVRLYRRHAPWVKVGGSYSVDWHKTSPFDLAVVDLFKASKWSSLNVHSQTDLDKAAEFGGEVQIYNQGRTRYSFGAYQWAEMHKGVKARMQWHLLALHGYQFFDLDGREPDTAMIHWTTGGVVPTIHLPRCREGADDFRYAVTLWNLARRNGDAPAAKDAIAWLDQVGRQIPVNANGRPAGFMDDETFRATCAAKIVQLMR